MTDDLNTWLDQQLENQRFRAEGLKTLAFALPAEARSVLTETAELLLADVGAKRRIIDYYVEMDVAAPSGWDDSTAHAAAAVESVIRLLAQSYASQPGYREEWRPV